MTELPLIVCDIQRAGPSTGMPTKTEQADLLQVMFGRNGEAPVPVLAPQSPSDCFETAIEAVGIAIKYRTPVIVLSDGYLANGAEPWRVPDISAIPPIDPEFATEANATDRTGKPVFLPYLRDEETLARPWAIPGHRQRCSTGSAASRRPRTPERSPTTRPTTRRWCGPARPRSPASSATSPIWWSTTRPARTRGAPATTGQRGVWGSSPHTDAGPCPVLVLGWGSTYGPIVAAVRRVRKTGRQVAYTHLRHLNPFPANLGAILRSYDRVIVPEMNLGQLALLLRAEFLVDVHSYSRVRGLPISLSELARDLEPRSTNCKE